ncbi:hypothetical protein [Lysinibacillus boronitolerans]|uniref:hypothetical protein n=1 Tax=Lysinibacillus boronitolerans TaxID=309788 RepID=UPI003855351F
MEFISKGTFLLKESMKYYRQYKENEFEHYKQNYLYLSLITLMKSTELFAKELLLQKDELLLYKNYSDDFLKIVISNEEQGGGGPLYFSADTDVVALQVINYSETLKRVKAYYILDNELINICKTLEYYENELLLLDVVEREALIECSMLNVFDFLKKLFDKMVNQEHKSERKMIEEIKEELHKFIKEDENENPILWHGIRGFY